MKQMIAAVALAVFASPVLAEAEIEEVEAKGSVSEVADRLVAAVEGAGATVFARVDHAGGAAKVDMQLAPMELVIFGNPKLGTPAMQDNPHAGLVLPLRVLVYEGEDGTVRLAWQDPEEMLDEVGVDDDLDVIDKMEEALKTLTSKAAGG